MKWLTRAFIILFVGLFLIGAGCLVYLEYLSPEYDGSLKISDLNQEVEVLFDNYGIPHIYAQNEQDLYFALGYIHASERLFQMELIRRVVSGRLSEILGEDLVPTDRFFRTLSIHEHARQAAAVWLDTPKEPWQVAAQSYLDGINQFIETGKTPIEFTLIGIPKEPFTVESLYLTTGYMAFGFAEGFKVDPLLEKMRLDWGRDYLKDLVLHHEKGDQVIPVYPRDSAQTSSLAAHIHNIVENLPISPLFGSNAWVLSPEKSASGQVIHANDPHIGYGQPAVWYEAHLECPGFSTYGYHLAGFPFSILGHNRYAAIGMTMFENDDVNFYRERINPADSTQVWHIDQWEEMMARTETIQIKGREPQQFSVFTSRHGPIISDIMKGIRMTKKGPAPALTIDTLSVWQGEPVALSWTYLQFPARSMEASYQLGHLSSMDQAREAVAMIAAPGLNIMYGDRYGNIAWWTTGRLPVFPEHVNTKFFLDGASGKDEVSRFLDFTENPQAENPPWGFVYSANNQPGPDSSGAFYPGYYFPESRAKRIHDLLQSKDKWSAEEMQSMMLDDIHLTHRETAREMVRIIEKDAGFFSPPAKQALGFLRNWDGNHATSEIAPTIFYKLLYHSLRLTFADELGEEDFGVFQRSPLRKRSFPRLIRNDSSLWWDNVQTLEEKESREDVISDAFLITIKELRAQLGEDQSEWQWGKVHTITHEHLVGRQEPLDYLFNVGPFPIAGGEEVINNVGFRLNGEGLYPATHGPSRRSVIDFADLENSMSILPSGQSGRMISPFYEDQAEMYVNGQFRKQLMNREEIEAVHVGRMILLPE